MVDAGQVRRWIRACRPFVDLPRDALLWRPGARDLHAQRARAAPGLRRSGHRAARRAQRWRSADRARLGDMHELGVAEAAMVFDSFTDPATGHYLSDHQAFCHRWRALGGDVWLDPQPTLSHVGAVVYTGQLPPP